MAGCPTQPLKLMVAVETSHLNWYYVLAVTLMRWRLHTPSRALPDKIAHLFEASRCQFLTSSLGLVLYWSGPLRDLHDRPGLLFYRHSPLVHDLSTTGEQSQYILCMSI